MNRVAIAVPVAIVLALSLGVFIASADDRDRDARADREGRIPGQYIVVLNDVVEDADATEEELLVRTRGERLHSYRTVLNGFSARMSESAAAALAHDPSVAYVSEDRVISIDRYRWRRSPPPEPDPSPEPSPSPEPEPEPEVVLQPAPTGVDRINAENLSNKGSGVHVAVIDTGIDTGHPDLKANIVGGKNCSTGSSYKDQNGHGTHVAGTIAALNNSIGVVGVAPEAKLWSVRVLDRNGNGTWSSVICGLDFVASKGPAKGGPIKVANMSLGGSGTSDNNCGYSNNDALHRAVCRVRDAGVTLVVAAGNSGANAAGFVPAAYDDAVITVSALADSDGKAGGAGASTSYGADDTFASFSNYGAPVDIAAPGVSINSTWIGKGYRSISGTSMATPHVSGAAALYLASNPVAAWTAVRDALVGLGEVLGAGHADPSGKHGEVVLSAANL